MGQWVIVIHGIGAHHNKKADIDADIMASDLVRQLTEAGQRITSADFVSGTTETLPKMVGT